LIGVKMTDKTKSKRGKTSPLKKKRTTQVCRAPRVGGRCPQCEKGRLDYDGTLQLVCPNCGYVAAGGGFT